MTEQPPQPQRPIRSKERVHFLDSLRGLAIFGILVINMGYLAWPKVRNWPIYPLMYGSELDLITDFLVRFLAKGKFYIIFTFLFGVGMAVQRERHETTKGFSLFFLRRLFWLAVIGAVHGLVIWNGDILLIYAMVGVPLLLFQKAKPWMLLVTAGAMFLWQFFYVYGQWYVSVANTAAQPDGLWKLVGQAVGGHEYAVNTYNSALQTYTTGSWIDVAKLRYDEFSGLIKGLGAWWLDLLLSYLLGVWAWHKGLFSGDAQHRPLLWRIMVWFGLVGVVTNLTSFFLLDLDLIGVEVPIGMTAWFVGKFFMGYAYVACLLLLWKHDGFARLFSLLAPAGRMALSNYLMHSIVFTLIFNSYGFGLMGQFGEFQVFLMGAALFGLQIVGSTWWLSRFRFGPLEWLWRTLTYMKLQPMKRV